jgi:hypothetical protein
MKLSLLQITELASHITLRPVRSLATIGISRSAASILSLIMWWFAVISVSGELQYLEYRDYKTCKIVHDAYKRVGIVQVTDCVERSNHNIYG